MDGEYYVYVLFRSDGRPFYVGMGKGQRWEVHERRAHLRRSHRDHLIASILLERPDIPKVKVREGLSKSDAFELEKALIAAIGREPSGPLINQTSGGDGVPGLSSATRRRMGEKTRERLKGRPRPPDVIAKITATKRAHASAQRDALPPKPRTPKPPKPPVKRRRSEANLEALRAFWSDPERSQGARQRISAALTGLQRSDEHRAKVSAAQRGRRLSDEWKKKIGENSRAAVMALSPERRSEITRKAWETRRARRNEGSKIKPPDG